MYNKHNPLVRIYAKQSPENLERVIAFVSSSIRERTDRLPRYMTEYRKRGKKSSWIWGNKKDTIAYIKKNRKVLYADMIKIMKAKKITMAHDLIMLFLQVPGLGLPKAGFVVQLVAGKAGCLDVHNIRKYLPEEDSRKGTPAWLQTSGNSIETKRKKATRYLNLCGTIGGSRFMWNNWCTKISDTYPDHFKTPNDVSELHMCIW